MDETWVKAPWSTPIRGQAGKKYKKGPEYLVGPESKKVFLKRKDGPCQKDTRVHREDLPTANPGQSEQQNKKRERWAITQIIK